MDTRKALVVARISRLDPRNGSTDASRIERDDETAREWAESHGREVVALAADRNTSGGTSPFKRPVLGPWLSDESKLRQYDELVVSTLDRLGRNAVDIFKIREWANEHNKRITILSPALTWPPAPNDFASPIVWDVLARLAEIELSMITKRYKDVRDAIRSNDGFYGLPPWGFDVVGDKYRKDLAPNPTLRPTIEGMIARGLRGDTLVSIAKWLDEQGIPSPRASEQGWAPVSVSNVLKSPSLKGRRVSSGGDVVFKHEGIISTSKWDELQRAMKRGSRGPDTLGGMLLAPQTVRCGLCNRPMYRLRNVNKQGNEFFYYRCKGTDQVPSKCANGIRADALEDYVARHFSDRNNMLGGERVFESVETPGFDYVADIAELEADIRQLDLDAPDYDEQLATLRAERSRLRELPSQPSTTELVPTGALVADLWNDSNIDERRDYLQKYGLKVLVRPLSEGETAERVTLYVPSHHPSANDGELQVFPMRPPNELQLL